MCGVGDHGAKLVATEAAPFGAGAFGGVDDGTGRVQADEQGDSRHQGTGEDEAQRGAGEIQQTLQK